ncbi:MAG: hypothetical protein ACMUIU_05315 [bacterium]
MKKRLYLSLAMIFFLSFIICLPAFSQQYGFPYCTDASYYCQQKVAQVPIPWQFWGIDESGNIIDRIRISPTWLTVPPVGEGPVFVRRQFTITPTPLPLDGLVWNFDGDNPPVVQPMPGDQRTWRMPDNAPVEVKIGEDLVLTIPTEEIIASQDFDQIGVLVAYEVLIDNEVVAHFLNQAIVEANVFPPKIVKILVNFDIHNKTDYNPTNFELDFLGMNFGYNDVEYATGFVVGTGEPWGANPGSPLIVRPIPGGTEVKWIQHNRPLKYCEWLHIGLVIKCVNFDCFNNPDDPVLKATVQGYWTIIRECQKKVAQVPLPWQFWGIDENGNIIDRIRISPTWLNPILPGQPPGEGNIFVQRQFAVMPGRGNFIPLEDLVWDSDTSRPALDLDWRQPETDKEPIMVTEDQDLLLTIPRAETDNAGAVFVAYEVMLESGNVVGHFINEAILDPQASIPKIIRILVNFDIHNNTNYEVTNFELDFHNLYFKCKDVLWAIGYVKGTNEPWGANSVNPLVVRPIPGGTEVKWVQPERPLKYCEWLHVGLMFDCTDFECFNNPADFSQRATVQGYWTIIESPPCIFKAPITSTGQPNPTAANVSRVFIGFDTEALTFPSPGPPPEYTVYSALDGSLLEDYREAGASKYEEWMMILQIGDEADPEKEGFYPVISWNPANLCPPDPDPNMPRLSLWHEDDAGNRTLLVWDMHNINQYQTKESEFLYVASQGIWFANYIFIWSREISVEMHMPVGWSMISLPVKPRSALVSDLFPDAVVAYGYDKASGYVRVNKLEAGKGYWILFYEEKTYTVTGKAIFQHTSTVNTSGWEMIGGCTFDAKATTDSCDIIVIYKYLPGVGYQRVYDYEFLIPGTGYWILLRNVITQCVLTVQGAP